MDVLAEGEAAMAEVHEHLTSVAALMQEAGGLAQDAQARIAESDARRGGFAGRLGVAKELANQLAEPAAAMEEAAASFDESLATIDAMIQYIITRANGDAQEATDGREFFKSVLGMVAESDTAEDGIRGMLAAVVNLRRIARDLKPVSQTMERALNRVLGGMQTIHGWAAPLRALVEDSQELPSEGNAGGAASQD